MKTFALAVMLFGATAAMADVDLWVRITTQTTRPVTGWLVLSSIDTLWPGVSWL